MLRTLYSGVSGLSANLADLDVIGNNIANSNTIGFKAGRVTFNEMLTQTIRGASRPVSGGLGGTNPQQVGLGTTVGSIDTNFNQGNFRTTGNKTDLAIQGPGFFILSDGTSSYYTRAGIFGLDSENVLVNPSTGMRVQGILADENGEIGSATPEDIVIDPSQVVPARPSDELQLIGNLDSNSDATETIVESPTFLVAATGGDELVHMSGQTQGSFGLHVGDVVRLSGRNAGVDIQANSFTIGTDGDTYQDLVDWLNAELPAAGANMSFAIGANGELQATNNGGTAIEGFSLHIPGKAVFNNNFNFPNLAAGETWSTADTPGNTTGEMRAYADETDLLVTLYDNSGTPLNIDIITNGFARIWVGGSVGGNEVADQELIVDGTTTVEQLLNQIQYALGINSNPVVMSDEGQVVVRGEVGTMSALGDINITEEIVPANSVLETAFSFNQVQQATDQRTYSVATTVFDSLGGQHTINFTFEKVAGANEWVWTAEMEGGEQILTGAEGRVNFNDEGAVSNFTFADGAQGLSFRPQSEEDEGAAVVTLDINYGDIGGLSGLTQFEGGGSLQSLANGYGTGRLVDYNIDQSGLITGRFSNDTMRAIAQIAIVQFSNPAGLTREANNSYRRSGNSGQPVVTFAGEGNGTTIVPGTLETSNVDLADQFTRLVIAQRAFQANARVITTGDQVMQELVSLVR